MFCYLGFENMDRLIEREHPHLNIPNTVTVLGLGAGALWLAGFCWGWGIASIIADEIDGPIARATGQTSEYGANLDFYGDMAMLGAVVMKLNAPWLIPVLVPYLAAQKTDEPYDGQLSARAVLMLAAIGLGK